MMTEKPGSHTRMSVGATRTSQCGAVGSLVNVAGRAQATGPAFPSVQLPNVDKECRVLCAPCRPENRAGHREGTGQRQLVTSVCDLCTRLCALEGELNSCVK